VTSPIYASTPQALTDAATIVWNPANGLNASVTLGGNRTLSFTATPAVGSYGTLIVTQDATGGRTINLPSTSNKVLGSTSTTTIALSSAANAKDILNFYYDGTNCYWNIGQGYGSAATVASTNLASGVSGTLPVANGGTGATTLTANNVLLGNGTSALQVVAPGASGNVLTSNGTTWNSSAPAASGVPYTGATQAVDLGAFDLKVNGITVGRGNGNLASNTATGKDALLSNNTNGGDNTAMGNQALYSNTFGRQNTAVGSGSLNSNINGIQNTAVGILSLEKNVGVSYNTAVGAEALRNTVDGESNTATGASALKSNISGAYNSAFGRNALVSSRTAYNNAAFGAEALSDNLANGNSAYGAYALQRNTTGYSNTAVGLGAMKFQTTGNDNVAIGVNAGLFASNQTTGSNNTAIGAFAEYGAANLTNATVIGSGATVSASNTIQLGNTAVTNVKTSGTLTAGSVTYPNTHGSTGQVLSTTGSGTLTWVAPAASSLSGTVAVANGGTGATTLTGYLKGNGTSAMTASSTIPVSDVSGAAPLASPALTGTPTAPTATSGTNTTQVATTAFVTSALSSSGLPSQSGNNGKFLTTNGSSASWATGVSGSGTLNYIPRFSSSSALSNSSLSDDGTGLRIGNPNGTGGIYTGLSSYDNTRLMVSGGREYESIRMTFPGDPYNNELSFNWYGSAWRMRTERSSAEITDLSFWKTTGAGVTTEKMRIDGDGYIKATGFKTQNGTSSQFLKANGTVDNSTYLTTSALTSPALTGTPTAPTAAANTNTTQIATTAFVTSALTTAGLPSQSGNNGKFLTTNGSAASWASSPGVPYSGATGAVNLGNYNLTVYGVKVGVGSGPDPYFLQYSTVVGKDALVSNTYGWQNNAFGFEAMNQNTTGNGNNAFGLSAMRSNTSGNNNVAVGQAALHSSVTGSMNTAVGASAAYHSLGSQVTSIGYESLMGQGTGTGNTALGWRAGAAVYGSNTFSTFLGNNATAQNGTTNATAIGNDAFVNTSNTIQLGNTSITNVKTSGTLTAGNVTYPNYHNSVNGQILTTNGSGVASWTNTIAIANGGTGATTSAAALTNLGAAPLVSPAFSGTPTATTASTGTNNTQIATTAFVNSSISSANSSLAPIWSPTLTGTPTAPTAAANTNTTQIATTAFVASALTTAGLPSQSGNNGKFLTTNGATASWASSPGVPYSGATGAVNLGDYNLTVRGIKIGTSGTDNTALQSNLVIGRDALVNTTNGYNNMAIGNTALGLNVGGYNNVAIGSESQYKNLWGWGNVSFGTATLNQNVVGNFNTAVGHGAGYFLTSSGNTAIGHNALDGQADGGGNTGVGYNAGGVPWNQRTYNSTFLGYNAKAQSGLDNVIVIGYNAYTNEHHTIQLGDSRIVKLKTSGTIWSNGSQLTSDARLKTNIQPLPNSIDLIMKLNPVHYTKKNSIESTNYAKTENGFIAQELQKVLPYLVIEGTDKDKILSVDYNSIIPVLTKGIQEQQLLIKTQQKQIDEMRIMLDKLIKDKK
jgi:hypothetical protein